MVIENKRKQAIAIVDEKSPAISAIVPGYSSEKYVKEYLDSVLAQIFQDFEVACIDNGSTDKSLSIFKKYTAEDSCVKAMAQKNAGGVFARNKSIAAACSKYIFPLVSDDIIEPKCLEIPYGIITTTDYAVVSPGGRYFGKKDWRLILPKPTNGNTYNYRNGIDNSSLYAKKFCEKYGGYENTFDPGMEDFNFCFNFLNKGKKVIRIPDRLFYYKIKPTEEYRNKQTNKKEEFGDIAKVIRANMLKKQLNMVKYDRIAKIIKIPRAIIRFIFRWKILKRRYLQIRIFKTPVYWCEIV